MTKLTSGYVELDGGKIYYEAAGAGEPLVLCHAGFVDSRMWNEQWAAFSQGFRVIRFDLRGFGKSSPAQGPVERRADLHQVLRELDINKATLVGCSLSGETVLDFALEHPEMVAALVMVSTVPGGFAFQGEPPSELFAMIAALQAGDLEQASELQNRLWIDGPFRQPEQVDPAVRRLAAEMNRIGLANQTMFTADSNPLNPLDPPAAGRLGEINVPTLIVAGGLDNPEILRAADVMAAAIDGSRTVIIPGCGHVPNLEQPAAFNQAVLDFLGQR